MVKFLCMQAINVEIKARSSKSQNDIIRSILQMKGAISHGTKRQIDTYFKTEQGRLKLREFEDRMSLIFYSRENSSGLKQSTFATYDADKDESLRSVLESSYGIWRIVDKQRDVFSIENVTFHLDEVVGLGVFMEIEVIDHDGTIGLEKLTEQCEEYLALLGIKESDLLEGSYSDMVVT